MASKPSSADELLAAIGGIVERGEEVLGVFVDELLGSHRVRDELSKTVRRAAGARKRVEGNIESLLTLLSVPTRGDYKRLLGRIDQLQGSLVNLNMKVDRLLAAQERSSTRPTAAPPPSPQPRARRAARARQRARR